MHTLDILTPMSPSATRLQALTSRQDLNGDQLGHRMDSDVGEVDPARRYQATSTQHLAVFSIAVNSYRRKLPRRYEVAHGTLALDMAEWHLLPQPIIHKTFRTLYLHLYQSTFQCPCNWKRLAACYARCNRSSVNHTVTQQAFTGRHTVCSS